MFEIDIYTICSLFGIKAIKINGVEISRDDFQAKYGEDFVFHANNCMDLITAELNKSNNDFAVIYLEERFNDFELGFCKIN